ncbi:MAG: outer membrane protein assembly factor BamD, partial [Planctomycetota bacterium]
QELKDIDDQLAWKDYRTGEYYQIRGNQQAANLYFQMVVENWPASKAAEQAKEMLVKNMGGNKAKQK